jgi:hypothetical protein
MELCRIALRGVSEMETDDPLPGYEPQNLCSSS